MTTVLSTTGTIFFIIAIGYLAVDRKVFSREALQVLGKYVVNLSLPALIFRALSGRGLSEISNVGYLGGYLLGSLTVLIVGYFLSRTFWKTSPISSTFDATGMACANSGFVGYPLLVMVLPSIAPTALALNMVVENLVIIPLVLILAERATAPTMNGRSLAKLIFHRVSANPIVLAMVAGIAVAVLDLPIPAFASNGIDLIAQSSIAVSLFVIGGTVAGISIKSVGKRVFGVVFGKLVFLPIAVWVGFSIMALLGAGVDDPNLQKAAIIMAATPAMSIYPVLAQRYGQEEQAATAMLLMTAMSFFTISGLLYLL
ncbi:MAG: AEC family transporter [Cognatishimia sp.]|uniref:AEC family transporter n=1 Tax=Cognatishimia sp. TaxID=2211648 RepID=UPI00405815B6